MIVRRCVYVCVYTCVRVSSCDLISVVSGFLAGGGGSFFLLQQSLVVHLKPNLRRFRWEYC